MSNRIVPTTVYDMPVSTGGFATASIAKTYSSGREKKTAEMQCQPRRSSTVTTRTSHGRVWPGLVLTFPKQSVFGAGRPPGIETPATVHGGAAAPPSHTSPSDSVVVRLPDSNTAAYTVFPSGLVASARGVSPKSVSFVSGVP